MATPKPAPKGGATVETDRTGRTVIRQKPGQEAPGLAVDGITDLVLKRELNKEFKPNLTSLAMLGVAADRSEEDTASSIYLKKLEQETEKTFERIQDFQEKIQNDNTKTPAAKLIRFDTEADKQLIALEKTLAATEQSCRADFQTAAKELFSSNATLSPLEVQLAPTILKEIIGGKTTIGLLASGSPSESRTALALAEHVPRLAGAHIPGNGWHDLAEQANHTHSPEAVAKTDAAKEGGAAVAHLIEALSKTRQILDKNILETIKTGAVK